MTPPCPERAALEQAVAALGDEHAADLRVCLDVLRLESDIAEAELSDAMAAVNRRAA